MTGPGDAGTAHLPIRPQWVCEIDLAEWPCAAAKVELAEEYHADRTALLIYLSLRMWEAVVDLAGPGAPTPLGLQDRFTGWVPRQPTGIGSPGDAPRW